MGRGRGTAGVLAMTGLVLVGSMLAGSLAGCDGRARAGAGSGGGGAAPSPSVSLFEPSAGAVGAGDQGGNPVQSGGPEGATAGGTRPCGASSVSLAQLPGDDGAAGTIVVRVRLTNTSSRPCTVRGYPDFRLTAPSASMGVDVPEAVTLVDGGPFATPVSTVTMAPGGTAGFYVAYSNRTANGSGACDVASKLHLTLPPDPAPVVGPVRIQVCVPTMHVSAYVPGANL